MAIDVNQPNMENVGGIMDVDGVNVASGNVNAGTDNENVNDDYVIINVNGNVEEIGQEGNDSDGLWEMGDRL